VATGLFLRNISQNKNRIHNAQSHANVDGTILPEAEINIQIS
jgi:hypothetical protein